MRRFTLSTGAVLAIAGTAKIWSESGDSVFLAVIDPIVGVRFGQLMWVLGLVEIAIALVCIFDKAHSLALGLTAWLSTNLVLYRFGLWWMDWKRPCGCLGNLTDALHISLELADNITKVLLAYLLVGSYGLLFWKWRLKGRNANGIGEVEPQSPTAA